MEISEEEKQQLKHRITGSVYSYIRRKRYVKYGLGVVAASLMLFFSINFFQSKTIELSPIESFAKSATEQNPTDKIQLILSDEQIDISENNSSITYSTSGQEVTIDKAQAVSQNTSAEDKMVFNTLIVPYGKRSNIELSDGSKIWLNSGSKLIFPASFKGKNREVYLEGEAIFEVAHDKNHPFIVKAEQQDIEVLGTVFNVSNYTDEQTISTVLKSGSIKINYKTDEPQEATESIKITPNTLATYNKDKRQIISKKVVVDSYFSWRDGIFIFKNDSMRSIMKKISRYYNIDIKIEDEKLANTTFSGYLDVKDNVENVIKTIQETTTFNYKLTENGQLTIN